MHSALPTPEVCAESRSEEARAFLGRQVTAHEVLQEIEQDRRVFERTGGGVTVLGGEPLYQPTFTIEMLRHCRRANIHTTIESSMIWPWIHVEPLITEADMVMTDIKTMNDALHRKWTGASNALLLDNLQRLACLGKPLIIRTPLVPDENDTADQVRAIAAFAATLPTLTYYELLPVHTLHSEVAVLADAARMTGIQVRIADRAAHGLN